MSEEIIPIVWSDYDVHAIATMANEIAFRRDQFISDLIEHSRIPSELLEAGPDGLGSGVAELHRKQFLEWLGQRDERREQRA